MGYYNSIESMIVLLIHGIHRCSQNTPQFSGKLFKACWPCPYSAINLFSYRREVSLHTKCCLGTGYHNTYI